MVEYNRKILRCSTTRSVLRQNERLRTVLAPKLGVVFLVGSKLPSSRTVVCFCTLLEVFSDSKLFYYLGKKNPRTTPYHRKIFKVCLAIFQYYV